MALGKTTNIPDDLRQLVRLAEGWCVANSELDLPLTKLLEWSTAVSPGTTNKALHLGRICRAVKADLLIALHPKDHSPLPYVVPSMLPDVVIRVRNVTGKVDMDAVAAKRSKRQLMEAEEAAKKEAQIKRATLGQQEERSP